MSWAVKPPPTPLVFQLVKTVFAIGPVPVELTESVQHVSAVGHLHRVLLSLNIVVGHQQLHLFTPLVAGFATWCPIDPGVVDTRGGQELGKEGPLCIGRRAGTVIPLHVNLSARVVHCHGLQGLRLSRQWPPF